jgi:hypothetical protein
MAFSQLRHDMYWTHSVRDMAKRRIPKLMGAAEIQARLGYSPAVDSLADQPQGLP